MSTTEFVISMVAMIIAGSLAGFSAGQEMAVRSAREAKQTSFGTVTVEEFTNLAWHPVLRVPGRAAEECGAEPEQWAMQYGLKLDASVPHRLVYASFHVE